MNDVSKIKPRKLRHNTTAIQYNRAEQNQTFKVAILDIYILTISIAGL